MIFSAIALAISGFLSAPAGNFIRIETWFSAPKRWMVGSPKPRLPTVSRSSATGAAVVCVNVARIIWPPIKSTPKFKPLVATNPIDAIISSRLTPKAQFRHLRKSMLVSSGTTLSSFISISSNRQFSRTGALNPARYPHAGDGHGGEHRCDDPDHQNHGKATDWT